MEGSPVFGEHAQLTGMLIRPLRQRDTGAEVQVTENSILYLVSLLSYNWKFCSGET